MSDRHPEWENGISPAKMAQGRRDVARKCHCGKRRDRHTAQETNLCKKSQGVDTIVTRMSEKDINKAELMKI